MVLVLSQTILDVVDGETIKVRWEDLNFSLLLLCHVRRDDPVVTFLDAKLVHKPRCIGLSRAIVKRSVVLSSICIALASGKALDPGLVLGSAYPGDVRETVPKIVRIIVNRVLQFQFPSYLRPGLIGFIVPFADDGIQIARKVLIETLERGTLESGSVVYPGVEVQVIRFCHVEDDVLRHIN